MIRLALDRPISTLIAALALAAIGTASLLRLPVALLPELEKPQLTVLVTAEGRSREELVTLVAEPLERRLRALAGVTAIRSFTEDGRCRLIAETEWQADGDRLRIEAERQLEGAAGLPVRLEIAVTGNDPSPIVEIAAHAGGDGTALVDDVLVPELARLPSCGRIEVLGRAPLMAVVRPHAASLLAHGLTADDVRTRLEHLGRTAGIGQARDGAVVRPMLVRDRAGIEELGGLRIPPTGAPLAALAEIGLAEVPDNSGFRRNGRPAILVRVFRAPGESAVELSRGVRAVVAALGAKGAELQLVSDRSREVVAALGELGSSALFGFLFGTVVLVYLLGRWLPALALALVIPVSILASFSAFHFAGVPLDVISLGGLALAAGMLVDSSIVVLEAIESGRARGESALAATRAISPAVISGVVTSLVVFLPFLWLEGLARAVFGEQAFAIVVTGAASLLFSLTLTPVLAGRHGAVGVGRQTGRDLYLRLLTTALERPTLVWVGTVIVVAIAALLGGTMRRELFPPLLRSAIRVELDTTTDLTPEAAAAAAATLESRARTALAGRATTNLDVTYGLSGPEGRADKTRIDVEIDGVIGDALAALTRAFPEGTTAPRPDAFVEAAGSSENGLELLLAAGTPERLSALEARVSKALGGRRSRRADRDEVPALRVIWDHARLQRLGASATSLEASVRAALTPGPAGRIVAEGREVPIWLARTEPASAEQIPLAVPAGRGRRLVPLGALARLEPGDRAPLSRREDGRPAGRLVIDRLAGDDPLRLAAELAHLATAADERIEPAGRALELAKAIDQMRWALLLAILLVYLTLAATFESATLPLLILVTVPVAAFGALALLFLVGSSLNLLAGLGLVLLVGIVVNNAIVLVHRIEEGRARGESEREAILAAATERYRPILMTTLTALLGMLPLALVRGEGELLRQALAVAVLGGLVTSTLASLIVVPVLHARFSRR